MMVHMARSLNLDARRGDRDRIFGLNESQCRILTTRDY
jgi:hypothetical protein